jgi:pimeloyl-ACP methyl ester carboxylesterase
MKDDPHMHALLLARRLCCLVAVGLGASLVAHDAMAGEELPAATTRWNGFAVHTVESDGRKGMVVAPETVAAIPEGRGKPWVWIGEFPHVVTDFETRMLRAGYHIVYLPTPNQFGMPPAMKAWEAFYDQLTTKYGFDRKPALVGISRGGLYVYSWAALHPDRVSSIYGDAPVCNVLSWPGGKAQGAAFKGPGSEPNWKMLKELAGAATDAEMATAGLSPIDKLEPLAKVKLPLLHVYGDADEVVPWDENTGELAKRYQALGGEIRLIPKPGVKHHPHGLPDSTPIVEFVTTNWERAK